MTTSRKMRRITFIQSEAHIRIAFSFTQVADPFSEIILTIGNSKTVEAFLKSASHYRNFTVITAETGPSFVLSFSC
jgi:translation initiation factor 2B subunit (eIF-2B alpha/beta/delta family)